MPSPRPASAEPTAAPVSDLEAVDEVLRGNREMFEVLVRRYNPQLYRVGIGYLRDHARAEDAMQNAYVSAFLHLHRFQRTAAFSTWLTRIMVNECLMQLRRSRAHPLESLEAAQEDGRELTPPVTTNDVQRNEMKALLESVIAGLPENYRLVYLLREIQGLSTAETAACLGLSAGSVKVLLHRARARLRSDLLASAAASEVFSYHAEFCTPMTERVMRAISTLHPVR